MNRIVLLATVVTGLSAATVFAQDPAARRGAETTHQAAAKMGPDQHFVMEAASAGMAEVELGKLAATNGISDEVKKFGQRMVDDHTKANDELKPLAQTKGITLPAAVDAKHKTAYDRLAKMSGEQFDRAYMQAMVADHREAVGLFRKESSSGQDAELKAWASKTLPTLEDHLKQAQAASKAVGTSGTAAAKKTPKL